MNENWIFFEKTLETVPANLALDDALLEFAEQENGPGYLRVWESQQLAVVLGASGRVADDLHLETCQAHGVTIARRTSGGGTVVIGPGALNITVVQRIDASPAFRAVDTAQVAVLSQLAESLRQRVPGVGVAGSGDLILGDRKFSGSAQRRLRNWFMIHASILYQFPLDQISLFTALPKRQPDYRKFRDHNQFVTNLPTSRPDLVIQILNAFTDSPSLPEPGQFPQADALEKTTERLANPEWIYRF